MLRSPDPVVKVEDDEVGQLKIALARKTHEHDFAEERLDRQAQIISMQDAYIAKLEEDQKVLNKSWQHTLESNMELGTRLRQTQEQLSLSIQFRQVLERFEHATGVLSSMLAEERSAKRRRE